MVHSMGLAYKYLSEHGECLHLLLFIFNIKLVIHLLLFIANYFNSIHMTIILAIVEFAVY